MRQIRLDALSLDDALAIVGKGREKIKTGDTEERRRRALISSRAQSRALRLIKLMHPDSCEALYMASRKHFEKTYQPKETKK
jgi:hypothetical protein